MIWNTVFFTIIIPILINKKTEIWSYENCNETNLKYKCYLLKKLRLIIKIDSKN